MNKDLEMAEQQLTGFAHAAAGYSIEQTASAMGLKKEEWLELRKNIDSILDPKHICDLDTYFGI